MKKLKAAICRSFIKFDKETKKQAFAKVLYNLLNRLKSNNLKSIISRKFYKTRSKTFWSTIPINGE